jgi:catechol 2,3-dioxygenase-like lactoylglutathione lyase family enzyme
LHRRTRIGRRRRDSHYELGRREYQWRFPRRGAAPDKAQHAQHSGNPAHTDMFAAVLSGIAHTGVCVPDLDAAVAWYTDVLGLDVLSPPYKMSGPAIERDMGELLPSPVVVKAAILGIAPDDHVLEVLEYPTAPGRTIVDRGITHVGLLCDDVDATRALLETRGVRFLTTVPARVAGLTTTWFVDPWDNVFILMAKRHPDRPYWRQYAP